MQKIKQVLERYPTLYRILRRVYLPVTSKYVSARQYLDRNRLGELWAKGYLGQRDDTAKEFRSSVNHSHRSLLISKIAEFSPILNILEIGCGSGPNLYLLAKEFPNAEIRGIDINPKAVQIGNNWFAQEGIRNVRLSVGRAEELSEFGNKSFDVVFTDAALIYVSRKEIYKVAKDIVRITRKGIIFVERHNFGQCREDTDCLGVYTNGLWVRDYVALLKRFVPEERICVTRITADIWPDNAWRKYGALIKATTT